MTGKSVKVVLSRQTLFNIPDGGLNNDLFSGNFFEKIFQKLSGLHPEMCSGYVRGEKEPAGICKKEGCGMMSLLMKKGLSP